MSYEEFNSQDSNDECLEIKKKPIIRVTDEQAQKIIFKYSRCKSVAEFQKLKSTLKEKHIKKIHENGVSIRQIVRLCGESKGIVEKCLR